MSINMKKQTLYLLWIFLIIICIGCNEEPQIPRSNMTPGMVKTKIVNGVTSQSEIVEIFGPPNIISKNKSGNEVWTYDKVYMEKSQEDGYWNVLVAGGGGGRQSISSKTFTLMIEFDSNDIVKDNSYRSSQF